MAVSNILPFDRLTEEKVVRLCYPFFPNPTKNDLNMDFSQVDWALGDVVLHVYNSFGKQVHSETFYSTEIEQLNLENLSSSIYFFQFIQGENVFYQTKVIKEN